MDAPKLFENPQFGAVRVVMRDGDPWFVAVDVCRALDLSNPSMAVQELDDDEKIRMDSALSNTEGLPVAGFQDLLSNPAGFNIISESGLYSLVIRSIKPEAKVFKRWITRDVLPQIRKTGAYIAPHDYASALRALADAWEREQAERAVKIAAYEELKEKTEVLAIYSCSSSSGV